MGREVRAARERHHKQGQCTHTDPYRLQNHYGPKAPLTPEANKVQNRRRRQRLIPS